MLELLALTPLLLPQAAPDTLRLVTLPPGVDPALVRRLELDVASNDGRLLAGVETEVVADAQDLVRLRRAGVPFEVRIDDLIGHYGSRLVSGADMAPEFGAWLSPAFGAGGMGGYYTFAEVESVLDQMTAAYPSLVTAKASIGQTLEGREQWMIKISDNPGVDEGEPEVRFDAMHHAREPQSMQATLYFALWLLEEYGTDPLATYLVDEREIYILPVVNPDGYVYNQSTNPGGGGMWRKNRRNNGGGSFGVDPNRNYDAEWGYDDIGSSPSSSSETYRGPAPTSEPEIANMQAFIDARDFKVAITVHAYSNLWLYPLSYDAILPANLADYTELSPLMAEINGYLIGPGAATLYPANGVTDDYDHIEHGTMAWLCEIGTSADGFWPPTSRIVPLAEENRIAFARSALAAGPWLRAIDPPTDLGDGDGFYESGETLAFPALRNSGVTTSGSVDVSLSSSSPHVSIGTGLHTISGIAPFTTGLAGAPVTLSLLPSAPPGSTIDVELTVTYDGFSQAFPVAFQVGEARPYLHDDLEIDHGWTAGLPSDTAATGLWEYGDPIGTNSSGAEANPEDDASPDPASLCFMTGNGGGSGGTDDVDDGLTTLLSPRFDLSGANTAFLSYARWYALLSTVDDVFTVELSNNGGGSWVTLETVSTNENAWNEVQFDLAGVLPFTDDMQLRFIAEDDPNNSLVEAAIDELKILTYDRAPRVHFYGDIAPGNTVQLNVSGRPGAAYTVQWTKVGSGLKGGATQVGKVWSTAVRSGTIPPSGLERRDYVVPAQSGETLSFRVQTLAGGEGRVSNIATLQIP